MMNNSSVASPATSILTDHAALNRVVKVPVDKLWSVPMESLVHKPHLHRLFVELRSKYVSHLLRNISSPALQKLKKEDNEVFCTNISEIVQETESIIDELDFEEFNLGTGGDKKYLTLLLDQRHASTHIKDLVKNPSPIVDSAVSQATYDQECFGAVQNEDLDMSDEEEEEDNEQEYEDDASVTSDMEYEEMLRHVEEQKRLEADFNHILRSNSVSQPASTLKLEINPPPSHTTQDTNQTLESIVFAHKSEQVSHQIQNTEPIKNGSLCFNQHHHIVVGKYDRDLLIKENRLKCCAMKKSTLTIFLERKNSKNGKIMKREKKAKSIVRFYRINVDFNHLVSSFMEKQIILPSIASNQ